MKGNREQRLLGSFINLIDDHCKDFEGFVRDVENVRYCHTPIDSQQVNRCEYALRNMEVRLLTINNCIHSGVFEGLEQSTVVEIKNDWAQKKARVDGYLRELDEIINSTAKALRPVRQTMEGR